MPRKKKPISAHPRKVYREGTALNVIADQLRAERKAAGMTQDDLAAACQRRGWDIDRLIVVKIETGKRRISDAELKLLAEILKVSADLLLGRSGAQ